MKTNLAPDLIKLEVQNAEEEESYEQQTGKHSKTETGCPETEELNGTLTSQARSSWLFNKLTTKLVM